MKISVVIATYNGEKFFREQLDTIRNQTQRIDELIICDDCSSDKTVEIAEKYFAEYNLCDSWKIIVNESNLGYANNFNKATMMASGDIIFFSDQDDLWDLNKVQIMMDIMKNNPDCEVLCTDYEPMYDGENVPKASKKLLNKMPNNGMLEKISLSKKSVYIGAIGCCMCVRKEFYHKIEEYWFDGWAQDDRMWRLAQCVDGCFILHSNLIKHRIHTNNTSTYGKYHTTEKRIQLFNSMQKANVVMKKILTDKEAEEKKNTLIEKHIAMMKARIELLECRKWSNSFGLIAYLGYYQEIKSFLVELYMIMKKM